MVKPTFGKIKAHQFSVKCMSFQHHMTDTVDSAQNQNASSQRNIPEGTPMAFQTSPTGKDPIPRKSGGITFGA